MEGGGKRGSSVAAHDPLNPEEKGSNPGLPTTMAPRIRQKRYGTKQELWLGRYIFCQFGFSHGSHI